MFVGVYQSLFSGLCDTWKRRLIRKSALLGSSHHVCYSLISKMTHTTNLNIFIDTNSVYRCIPWPQKHLFGHKLHENRLTCCSSGDFIVYQKSPAAILKGFTYFSLFENTGKHLNCIYMYSLTSKHPFGHKLHENRLTCCSSRWFYSVQEVVWRPSWILASSPFSPNCWEVHPCSFQ